MARTGISKKSFVRGRLHCIDVCNRDIIVSLEVLKANLAPKTQIIENIRLATESIGRLAEEVIEVIDKKGWRQEVV